MPIGDLTRREGARYPDPMPLEFASRVGLVRPFLAMEVMERALELERAGAHIVHLEVGEPDFPPPPGVSEACERALLGGETRYTDSRGLAELREAIVADHERRSGVRVSADHVLVTNGTSPAMLLVFSLLVSPGDEVILPAPYYPCYPGFIRVAGGIPVAIPTRAEDAYRLDIDAVKLAISPRTRAIIVGSPSNPTGAVQSADTLRQLVDLGIPLISDEIYNGLVYEGAAQSALGLGSGVFVLDGFSKRYAMTGFRLGYVIAPEQALRPLQTLAQNIFISANSFVQRAGIAALEHGAETLAEMREVYTRRRRAMLDGLREIGFRVPTEPAGAFYIFADARAFASDSRALAFELLERAKVAVTPGIDFGETGEGWLRFSYAASDDDILEGLARLAAFLR